MDPYPFRTRLKGGPVYVGFFPHFEWCPIRARTDEASGGHAATIEGAAKSRLASISIKNDRLKFTTGPQKRDNPTLLPFSRLLHVRCLSANKAHRAARVLDYV